MYTFEYTSKRQNTDSHLEDAHESVKLSIVNWIARKSKKKYLRITFFLIKFVFINVNNI